MRLIDADALTAWIINELRAMPNGAFNNLNGRQAANLIGRSIDDAPTVGGWISVKDRLPGCDDGVVIAIAEYDDGWCTVLAWRNEKTGWDTDDPLFEDGMEVTHWMPLPEPPKEVTGDD